MYRMKQWREKRKAEGMVQVRVWVPAGDAKTILDMADSLRPAVAEIDGEKIEPGRPDTLAYAYRIANRNRVPIPPPMERCAFRLSAWIRRNRFGPSPFDEKFEERRQARIIKLIAELEKLT